jgi:small nuclear ribonucleoprotein (snRNP)-like protein
LANKIEQLGASCEITASQNEEISLEMESDDAPLSIESSDNEVIENEEQMDHSFEKDLQSPLRMICPSCGFEQAQAKECCKCGIIVDRYQDTSENILADSESKKDVLQEYLKAMSKMPEDEAAATEKPGTSWFLKMTTALILLTLFSSFGWSYYYFVYKKPWLASCVESVTVQDMCDPSSDEDDQLRLQSKKETILALQKALERKKNLQSRIKSSHSNEQFKLKNIPIPLLRHYIGKYVWVTCDNDSVHQGTLYALYTEQVILKKPRFNLTIPINLSMIKTVEYDMSETEYDDDAVEAYQSYKRQTEEALQQVSLSQVGKYRNKNLRIHLDNGQVYEGILNKYNSEKIILKNVVYGQMVTFVIRKESIQKIFY